MNTRPIFRPLPLLLAALLLGTGGARAAEAVLHLRVGDAKEDELVVIALAEKDAPVTDRKSVV